MTTRRAVSKPDAFALAVREEVLGELGRRGLNSYSLSKLIDRGPTYLTDRLKQAEKELTLNDLELICTALSIDLNALMDRATRAYEAEAAKATAVRDRQDAWRLAAKEATEDVPEE